MELNLASETPAFPVNVILGDFHQTNVLPCVQSWHFPSVFVDVSVPQNHLVLSRTQSHTYC